MKTPSYKAIFLIALAMSVVGNLWQYSKLQNFERKPNHHSIDQPFIDKAVALWASHAREDKAKVMSSRYAKAMYLKNEICISLALEMGSVGGSPVYCFDEKTGILIRKYDDVE